MHSPIEQLVGNSDLAEIIRRGGIEPDQLSDTEWFQYGFWFMMQFDMYEFLYTAHVDCNVDPHIWHGVDSSWANIIKKWPGVRRTWREWRHAYGEDFRAYVDGMVDQAEYSSLAKHPLMADSRPRIQPYLVGSNVRYW